MKGVPSSLAPVQEIDIAARPFRGKTCFIVNCSGISVFFGPLLCSMLTSFCIGLFISLLQIGFMMFSFSKSAGSFESEGCVTNTAKNE